MVSRQSSLQLVRVRLCNVIVTEILQKANEESTQSPHTQTDNGCEPSVIQLTGPGICNWPSVRAKVRGISILNQPRL